MAWPTTAVSVGDLITAAQLNLLPIRLADTTLGAGAASIDFTSIPSVYAHLMIVAYCRGANAASTTTLDCTFNGDTGANYDKQRIITGATTVAGTETFGATRGEIGEIAAASAGANLFGAAIAWIPYYANSADNKMLISVGSYKYGTSTTNIKIQSKVTHWRSNAAINQVTILAGTGNLDTGSRISLYGLV